MIKKILVMAAVTSVLAGPLVYLSIVDRIGKDNLPSLTLPETGIPDWLESAGNKFADRPASAGGESLTVYKWRNDAGVWQFSNEPPGAGGGVETVVVAPNSSVRSFAEDAQTVVAPSDQAVVDEQDVSQSVDLLPTPERVQKLIEDARNVQTLVDERGKQIESASN
ncbi:hypothetical protein Tel_13285 [Candidatus Tenderia electrophaga]|uniref:DUF4124 domain-containing protein n=1 Tax=Candidatus Tenderia electrophaga TaxID=1748243 RepID=A0A0S2TFW3_9GAMM|nr:hypothetical protein Tel_13285 [Candidatus Tenderia electrophaga]